MKRITIFCAILLLCACAGRQLSESGQNIQSISDTSKCQFIKSGYCETRPHNIAYYVQLNAERAGGNAYKILNVSSQMVMGVNIQMVTFEIYKCPGN